MTDACLRGHRRTPGNIRARNDGATECLRCSAASARMRRRGLGGYVPAEPSRQKLLALREAGMTWAAIIEQSGLTRRALFELYRGERTNVTRSTARIMASLRFEPRVEPLRDATGTRRRVQALGTLGWSYTALAAQAGLSRRTIDEIVHGRNTRCTPATAERISAVYDDLWQTPPPSSTPYEQMAATRTARKAARLGWMPPLAWNDDELDDPDAQPASQPPCSVDGCSDPAHSGGVCNRHYKRARYGTGTTPSGVRAGRYDRDDVDELAVEAFLSGHRVPLNHADAHAVIVRLLDRGDMTHSEIGERVGTTARTVDRISSERRNKQEAA